MSQPTGPDTPVRYDSRYGSPDPTDDQATADRRGGRACPICQTSVTSARARYCSDACKQRAYRLRQTETTPLDLDALTATLRSRQALVACTVYECPTCETRLLGEQRCPDCHVFCRRLGLGGACPHCDEPVTLADLLNPEEVQR
jgi:hypothetical protein